MTVLITLTTAGADTGPFDLYSDVDGYLVPFENNVPKASLVSGYTSVLVPGGTTIIRVKSDSLCTNYIDLVVGTTTTTTSSSTTTTTTSSSTTTTTTTAAVTYEYRLYGYGVDTADTCGEVGTWVELGGPSGLTVYAFSPTLAGVTLFYNNPAPILGAYINGAITDGWRVKFALASGLAEEWVGFYNNTTGAISGNVDCTP